jgi:hypothetical protein
MLTPYQLTILAIVLFVISLILEFILPAFKITEGSHHALWILVASIFILMMAR